MNYKHLLFFLSVMTILSCSSPKEFSKKQQAPNILFIAIDDLRPQLNCYGASYMHTPNLDQLATEGRLFKNHFVQVPTCGASRYAMLLGQYPQYKKYLSNNVFRDDLVSDEQAGLTPLPKAFKNAGYYTASLGKIGHYVDGKIFTYDGQGDGRPEMPNSWDYEWGPTDQWGTAWNAFFGYANGKNRTDLKKQVAPTEFIAEKDEDLPDGLIAEKAINELKKLKNQQQPFFLGVGFFKPHLPFVAPKKYWDLYEGKTLPISPNPAMPMEILPNAVQSSGEMFGNYKNQPEKGGRGIRLSDEYAMHLRRSYFAAVSYMDAQVGKVLQTLKETGLDKNTIVVVWGDHGWHLGDHTVWGKHTLFERALRSAFIIKTPDLSKAGTSNESIVESVDIYPTLLELANVSTPNTLSGKSLVPLLNNPSASLDKPALSFWRNGYSMRTATYRFSKYKDGDKIHLVLFDHTKDQNEEHNVANQPAYAQILKELDKQCNDLVPAGYWESL